MKNTTYDYLIVGAGVVGSMIARWLSRYQADILLIESIRLKAPAVVTYVEQNLDVLLVTRSEQFDPHLGARGFNNPDYNIKTIGFCFLCCLKH